MLFFVSGIHMATGLVKSPDTAILLDIPDLYYGHASLLLFIVVLGHGTGLQAHSWWFRLVV